MNQCSSSLDALLDKFRNVKSFRKETFAMFKFIVCGWIVCLGRRTISRVWETTGLSKKYDHSAAFRFFSQACWNFDELNFVLILIIFTYLIPGMRIWLAVDDTLCHKRGSKVAFGGIFLDAVLSTKKHKILRYGNNWVMFAVLVQLPWRDRWFALPICWRICAPKKKKNDGKNDGKKGGSKKTKETAPDPCSTTEEHKTKPELAGEMLKMLAEWCAPKRAIVVGDVAYMTQGMLAELPQNVDAIGPTRWDAAMYLPPHADAHKNRKKGDRLPTPKEILADDENYPATLVTIAFASEVRELEVKVVSGVLWYGVTKDKLVQFVLVRDPKGEWRNECLVCTDLNLSAEEIITGYCRRWSIEVAFHDSKQYLGFHDPQVYCENSVERAAPMAWFISSLLLVWYAIDGHKLQMAHRHRPWYRHKETPTFADILATCRLDIIHQWLYGDSADNAEFEEKLAWFLEYAATAA